MPAPGAGTPAPAMSDGRTLRPMPNPYLGMSTRSPARNVCVTLKYWQ